MKARVATFEELIYDLVDGQPEDPDGSKQGTDHCREIEDRLRQALQRDGPTGIQRVGLVTGKSEEYKATLQTCLNPRCTIRQRKEAELGLQILMDKDPLTTCVGAVVTNGIRTGISDIGDRLRDLNKPMRRLNQDWERRDKPYKVALRCSHLAIARENGNIVIHPHSHLIILGKGALREADFREMEEDLEKWFGGKCSTIALGSIPENSEFFRYLLKNVPIEELTDTEICELYQQLKRLRMVEPLGPLRDLLRAVRKSNRRLIRKANGEVVQYEYPQKRSKKEIQSFEEKKGQASEGSNRDETRKQETGPPKSRVLCLNLPTRIDGGIKEPTILIYGYDGNFDKLMSNNTHLGKFRKIALANLPDFL